MYCTAGNVQLGLVWLACTLCEQQLMMLLIEILSSSPRDGSLPCWTVIIIVNNTVSVTVVVVLMMSIEFFSFPYVQAHMVALNATFSLQHLHDKLLNLAAHSSHLCLSKCRPSLLKIELPNIFTQNKCTDLSKNVLSEISRYMVQT